MVLKRRESAKKRGSERNSGIALVKIHVTKLIKEN